MRFENVCLESLAYAMPPEIWTSEDIERKLASLYDRLSLPYGRLELMTGIRERRFWDRPILPSEAGSIAGAKVLEKSRFGPQEIDLLIHAAVCRDRLEPATAAYVHQRLGLGSGTQIFDLSNACLGFLNAMSLVAGMIQGGHIRNALIVAGENGRPLVERTIDTLLKNNLDRNAIKPYFANLTIGAGGVAAMLCHASLAPEGAPRLLGGIVETDTAHNNLCEGDTAESGDGLDMQTSSEELLNAGMEVTKRGWQKFKEETGWENSTPDSVITHQVGRAHQKRLFEELDLDPSRDFPTYQILGNVGSVSLPISMALGIESGKVQSGHKVALLGIGSGLSCIMLAMQL